MLNYPKLFRKTVDVAEAVEDITDLVKDHNNVLIKEDCMILNFG